MISRKRFFLKFLALNLLYVFVQGEVEVRCIARERDALLSFKNGLTDDSGILSSWQKTDECCEWYGVVCSNTTRHVISLDLSTAEIDGVLGGKVSSSLLELRHLTYLDLSYNDFGGDQIPKFIGSMKQLQHFHISNSNLSGIVPLQLGNLTNLRSLDLSYNYMKTDDLDWLSSLSFLSLLDLSQFDLSHIDWLQYILDLRSLRNLHFQSCNIMDVTPFPDLFVNSSSTSLHTLDLSYNHLTSSALHRLSNISTSLVKLDLSHNELGNLIPNAFEGLIRLEHLDLSSNMLAGEIPGSLSSLNDLRVLVLYDNNFSGHFDELFGNVSEKGWLVSLEVLDLANNQLNGLLPDLTTFSALTELYLDNNKFTGSLPLSLGQLSRLEALDVSDNYLSGTVSEAHLIELGNLKMLDLSFNSLIMQITPDWNPPFQLEHIFLEGCGVGPSFPKWIQTQRNLIDLDLSSSGIIDEIPKWLWSLSPSLENLFLSDNQITGTIPDLSSTLIPYIDVRSNEISGSIPLFHLNTIGLLLSQNMLFGSISFICTIHHMDLTYLDLSNNELSGEVPNCFEKMPNLFSLNLANNSFSGLLPQSLGSLHKLAMLQLRDNNLSGELPSTLRFCEELKLIDIGGNDLSGHIPSWVGASLVRVRFLNFHDNEFYGSIPPEMCHLTSVRILDISGNNLSGKIPDCFNNFTSFARNISAPKPIFGYRYIFQYNPQLPNFNVKKIYNEFSSVQWKGHESEYRKNLVLLKLVDFSSNRLTGNIPKSFSSMSGLISLNLSRNSLTGKIIQDIGQMKMLESLDLSNNKLSGEIPKSLGNLSFLDFLNLSNNNLSGKIPSSTQLQSFNTSSYAGNNGLCGKPMPFCPGDRLRLPTTTPKEEDDGIWRVSFMQGFIISLALGFIVGFWGVVGSLVLKKSWRYAYSNLLDDVGDWFYVRISIYSSKWRRS